MERPFASFPGAEEVDGAAAEDDGGGVAQFALEVTAGEEDVDEAGGGEKGRPWIEPDAEGAMQVGLGAPEPDDPGMLQKELENDADDDQSGDDLFQVEEAEESGDTAHDEKGDVGEVLGGVEAGEDSEVVAIASGGVGNAGVAEEKGKDTGEGGPDDEQSGDFSGCGTVDALEEEGDDGEAGGGGRAAGQFPPGEDAEDADVHQQIQSGNDGDGEENGAGDVAAGVLHFSAKEADVVVAPVVIGGDEHGGAEAEEEFS